METHKLVLWILGIILLSSSVLAKDVILSVSQDIKPGDDWRQSINLKNERGDALLIGTFVSDNGWCKWDNGKTVKDIELLPRETRVEVLIINIPEDVVLDKNVCIITFEGSHKLKTETYIIGGLIIVVVGLFIYCLIWFIRKRYRGRKKNNGNTLLEEALQSV